MKKGALGKGQGRTPVLVSHPYFSERYSSIPEAMAIWAIIPRDQTSGLLGHVPGAHRVPGDKGLDDDPGHGGGVMVE